MIPPFVKTGILKGMLPPGIHEATLQEARQRYGYTPARKKLLDKLEILIADLGAAGCRRLYINGSFVTARQTPGDFDCCWEAQGVNRLLLHPALLQMTPPRTAQKARYCADVFPTHYPSGMFGTTFLEFFQLDKKHHKPKGIIAIDISQVAGRTDKVALLSQTE